MTNPLICSKLMGVNRDIVQNCANVVTCLETSGEFLVDINEYAATPFVYRVVQKKCPPA